MWILTIRLFPKLKLLFRRRRIASGSGSDIQDVNQLIKQFDETRSLMRQMTVGKGIGNVMKKMTGSKKKKKK